MLTCIDQVNAASWKNVEHDCQPGEMIEYVR